MVENIKSNTFILFILINNTARDRVRAQWGPTVTPMG
jgi:hypothetical protein